MNLATLADAILRLLNVNHVNVCQCRQYSFMLLSICETAQQKTTSSPQTCQRELQGFVLVNPRLSIASALR